MKNQEILRKAIETYGCEKQMDKTMEECGELIAAINKLKRNGGILSGTHQKEVRRPNESTTTEYSRKYYNLCSKVADMNIMLDQLKLMLDMEAVVLAEERKIERMKQKLGL